HGFDRAGFELRARRREVDLRVVVFYTERGERTFDLQARVERQRTGVDLPASEVAPFLDLVLFARLEREADLDRVGPERLHGRALHLFLESLEAAGVGGELLERDVGAVEGLVLSGREAFHSHHGARQSSSIPAAIRSNLVWSPASTDQEAISRA